MCEAEDVVVLCFILAACLLVVGSLVGKM
jgi:hypothetical protein